jgi:ankyrin repeat protein
MWIARLAGGSNILTDDTIMVVCDSSELDGFPVLNFKIKAGNGTGIRLEMGDCDRDGLSISSRNSSSGLILSAVQGSEAMARRPIQEGGECGVTDRVGPGPISWAALNGYKAVMKFLLGTESVDLNQKDDTGRTPFSHSPGPRHVAGWR